MNAISTLKEKDIRETMDAISTLNEAILSARKPTALAKSMFRASTVGSADATLA